MRILIQDAKIFDTQSPHHNKVRNVLVSNGKISEVGTRNYAADRIIGAKGMLLSTGWFDLGTFIGDPGYEQKEDLESATEAAMAGGFTGLAMLPNTNPSLQTKNDVNYVTKDNASRLVQVHALASVTKGNEGNELTEMIDLHVAGAVAFTDGLKPIWHTDILLKSLQYLRRFDGLLIERPEDIWLNMYGQIHEGINSTRLGLKGMPRVAEEVILSRDLQLLDYAGGRIHFTKISTARSVELIKAAKKKLKLTCDIASYQPLLDDGALKDFDTHYKVNPPLREKADNDALIKGLIDGTIDIICSGHVPQDEESKSVEFDYAEYGMTTLQTVASDLVALSEKVDWEILIEKVTLAPRKLLGLPLPRVDVGEKANLTLLDPKQEWILNDQANFSKSRFSPRFGQQITGKVVAVFNNNKIFFDEKR